MSRQKNQVKELISRKEAESVIQEYAEATSEMKGIEADLELKIQKIREQDAGKLLVLKTKQSEAMDKLQYFAEFNKQEYFEKKKSMELSHGVIGFRIGTPKVKAFKTTLAKAFEAVRLAKMKSLIRIKEELDKDKIINSRKDDVLMSKLKAIGLEVVQDETFFVEAKEEVYAA